MARTDNFRKQHAEILTIAREIIALLSNAISPTDTTAIRPLMSKLAGVVTLHLAMEDKKPVSENDRTYRSKRAGDVEALQ